MNFSGWMNYHAHIDKGFLPPPHLYKDAPAPVRAEWTREAKMLMSKEEIKLAANKALEKMHYYGTTYVRTHVDVDPLFELRAMEALLEVKKEWESRVVVDLIAFNQEGFDRYPETEVLLCEALMMGADGIGGHTSMDQDGKKHIDKIFKLAEGKKLDWIEFHTDETGRPDDFNLPYLAQVTKEQELGEKVTAIHCCSLANVEEVDAMKTIEAIAESGMRVTTCPTAIATRALTRVKDLAHAGVRIQLGSDNLRDYFNPLGSGNMLQYGQLLAYVQRFYEPNEVNQIIDWLKEKPNNERVQHELNRLTNTLTYSDFSNKDLLAETPRPQSLNTNLISK
ncbi:amidohydrolase family protein [Evansella cellulosilytica]|uniref:Amidohydrolase 3 n=1 Tax=Evansella cellulosilytica (strain ATCC 21833 / DSM 2522 / FERM P-1141 / JCM 9156 / N-4) TaxID=649639 RepID=E6TRX6_EVAC2|nr:amidohydrolase family protein [Evansella cellulosilytica]ADU29499.1 Amidohydrolase 3 [Evansella cellulosilytica DSM 2522]